MLWLLLVKIHIFLMYVLFPFSEWDEVEQKVKILTNANLKTHKSFFFLIIFFSINVTA